MRPLLKIIVDKVVEKVEKQTMRKIKRKPTTASYPKVEARIPAPLYAQLKLVCDTTGQTRSAVVRESLTLGLPIFAKRRAA